MPLKSSPKRKECGDDTSLTSPTPDQRAPKVKRTDTSPTSPTPEEQAAEPTHVDTSPSAPPPEEQAAEPTHVDTSPSAPPPEEQAAEPTHVDTSPSAPPPEEQAAEPTHVDTSPTSPTPEERAAKVKLDRFNCERELDQNIIHGNLAELHTHLLGMGSADFWVSRIMKVYLPRALQDIEVKISKENAESKEAEAKSIFETLAKDFCQRPFLPKGFPVSDVSQTTKKLEQCWIDELEKKWQKNSFDPSLFTYDVVYGVKELCEGFNIVRFNDVEKHNARHANQKADLESLLTPAVECSLIWEFNERCKTWVIFDQRNWEFKQVEGITNKDLITLMELSPEVLASVRNAFEMLSTSGHQPTEDDRRAQFRGNFTPAFYPQRYALKDCIYEQRIEVLAILLNQVLSRYAKAGVKYIEFSVSAKDMANPRILQTLVFDSFRIRKVEGGSNKFLERDEDYMEIIQVSLDILEKGLNRKTDKDRRKSVISTFGNCKTILEKTLKHFECKPNDDSLQIYIDNLQQLQSTVSKVGECLTSGCSLSLFSAVGVEALEGQIEGIPSKYTDALEDILTSIMENASEVEATSRRLEDIFRDITWKDAFLQTEVESIIKTLKNTDRSDEKRKKKQIVEARNMLHIAIAEMRGVRGIINASLEQSIEGSVLTDFLKKVQDHANLLLKNLTMERDSVEVTTSAAKKLDKLKTMIDKLQGGESVPMKKTFRQHLKAMLTEEKENRESRPPYVERLLAKEKLEKPMDLISRKYSTYGNYYIRVIRNHIEDYIIKKSLQSGNVSSVDKQTLRGLLKHCLGKSSWEPRWVEAYGLYNEHPPGTQFRFLAAFPRVKPFKKMAKAYLDCFPLTGVFSDGNVDEVKIKIDKIKSRVEHEHASLSGFDALSNIISLHESHNISSHLDEELCSAKFLHTLYAPSCDERSLQDNEEANSNEMTIDEGVDAKNPDYKQLLEKLKDSLRKKDRLLCHFLVGLDWVGDELFMPTNWFCTNVVIDFVKWCHQTFNKRFGLRVHAGEGVQRHRANKNAGKAQRVYLLCMHTLITGITKIVEAGIPLRIGHGVAFCVSWAGLGLPKERNPENSTDGLEEPYVRSATTEIIGSERDFEDLYYRLRDFLKRCGDRNVPFEINPTSNDMLLLDTHGTSARAPDQALGAFSSLLKLSQSGDSLSWKSGIPRPIICTDNDGIWAIHKCQKHYQHVSIAAEICDLIQRCGEEHPLLLKGAIDRLVDTSDFYFTVIDDIPQSTSVKETS